MTNKMHTFYSPPRSRENLDSNFQAVGLDSDNKPSRLGPVGHSLMVRSHDRHKIAISVYDVHKSTTDAQQESGM